MIHFYEFKLSTVCEENAARYMILPIAQISFISTIINNLVANLGWPCLFFHRAGVDGH